MHRQMQRLGVSCEFIRGVDYREMSEADFVRDCSPRAIDGSNYTRGVFAASLSHLKICQAIVDQGLAFGLVLEDDVDLPDNIDEVLRQIVACYEEDTVVLLRYYSHIEAPLELTTRDAVGMEDGARLLAPVNIHAVASAAAYIVSNEVARKMIARLYPVDHVPDVWGQFWEKHAFTRLRCYFPQVVADAPFVPLVEYQSTQSRMARLKSLLRKSALVNGIVRKMRRRPSPSVRQEVRVSDAVPFWVQSRSDFVAD